jgi:hypothetical protein
MNAQLKRDVGASISVRRSDGIVGDRVDGRLIGKRAARLHHGDLETERVHGIGDDAADLEMLQLRYDLPGAGHTFVVEPVQAVPAGPLVAHLRQPLPHIGGWSRDGDPSRGLDYGVRYEVVAGHGPAGFLRGGTPARARRRLRAIPPGPPRHA